MFFVVVVLGFWGVFCFVFLFSNKDCRGSLYFLFYRNGNMFTECLSIFFFISLEIHTSIFRGTCE